MRIKIICLLYIAPRQVSCSFFFFSISVKLKELSRAVDHRKSRRAGGQTKFARGQFYFRLGDLIVVACYRSSLFIPRVWQGANSFCSIHNLERILIFTREPSRILSFVEQCHCSNSARTSLSFIFSHPFLRKISTYVHDSPLRVGQAVPEKYLFGRGDFSVLTTAQSARERERERGLLPLRDGL